MRDVNFNRFARDSVGDENSPAVLVATYGFACLSYVRKFDRQNRVHR